MKIKQDADEDNDFFIENQRKEKIKQQLLEENFKEAKEVKVKKKKIKKRTIGRKPFLLLGIVLIIIGITCNVMVNRGPWLYYANYEPIELEQAKFEKLYYKHFEIYDVYDEEDIKLNNFFESESKTYLGISSDDFSAYKKMSESISYILVILGVIFIVIQIIFKIGKFDYTKSLVLHSLFTVFTALIFIYFIFSSAKFLAAFILYILNYNIIIDILGRSIMIFIIPLVLIFVFSVSLNLCFIALKTDYNQLESISESKKQKKPHPKYRYQGGIT